MSGVFGRCVNILCVWQHARQVTNLKEAYKKGRDVKENWWFVLFLTCERVSGWNLLILFLIFFFLSFFQWSLSAWVNCQISFSASSCTTFYHLPGSIPTYRKWRLCKNHLTNWWSKYACACPVAGARSNPAPAFFSCEITQGAGVIFSYTEGLSVCWLIIFFSPASCE